MEKKTGVELIAEERKRQIEVEGWTAEHDAEYDADELAWAAVCYAIPTDHLVLNDDETIVKGLIVNMRRVRLWPWNLRWWRPSNNRVRELAKAGALIAAEIDRPQSSPTSSGG